MMRQRLRSAALALTFGGIALVAACGSPPASESPQSVAEVKAQVAASIGSDGSAFELAASPAQVNVTVVNSPLASRSAPDRKTDAQRIVAAVAGAIRDRAEFRSVHTVHVDYITRNPDGSGRKLVDGFDFRKDPQGVFQAHLT
jgi:hypothetical protein